MQVAHEKLCWMDCVLLGMCTSVPGAATAQVHVRASLDVDISEYNVYSVIVIGPCVVATYVLCLCTAPKLYKDVGVQ